MKVISYSHLTGIIHFRFLSFFHIPVFIVRKVWINYNWSPVAFPPQISQLNQFCISLHMDTEEVKRFFGTWEDQPEFAEDVEKIFDFVGNTLIYSYIIHSSVPPSIHLPLPPSIYPLPIHQYIPLSLIPSILFLPIRPSTDGFIHPSFFHLFIHLSIHPIPPPSHHPLPIHPSLPPNKEM